MTIDKQTLALAREWAEYVAYGKALEDVQAVREVIQALPDEIVDAAKVRELIDRYREYSENHDEYRILSNAAIDLQALLPAPLVEVRMGAWAQHPEYGEVLITSDHPTPDGSVRVSFRARHFGDGASFDWVEHSDLSPLPDDEDPGEAAVQWPDIPEAATAFLKSNGFADTAPGGEPAPRIETHHHTPQEPEDPVFDSARMYYDQDGDTWAFNPGVGGWVHFDATDRGYSVPPAEYGPYTRIEKGDQ